MKGQVVMKIPLELQPFVGRVVGATKGSGIYFLFKGEVLVYIGQAKSVTKRLGGHSQKDYDSALSIKIPVDQLSQYEGALIRYFKPPLNKSAPRGGDDVAALIDLGLDPACAVTSRSVMESPASEMVVDGEEDSIGSYLFYEDDPLMRCVVDVLLDGGTGLEMFHTPCVRCQGADDDDDVPWCKCPRERVIGGVCDKVMNSCGWAFDITGDAWIDDKSETLYVTWSSHVKGRFENNKEVIALMAVLDEVGAWSIVFRCESDPVDKYWTVDRKLYRPGQYTPPDEQRWLDAQEYIRREIEAGRGHPMDRILRVLSGTDPESDRDPPPAAPGAAAVSP